jgi:di/tricarboxylate transporter
MTWEAWFTLAVIAAMLAVLIWNKFGSDIVIIGSVSLLVLVDLVVPDAEILSTKDALAGMANEGMLTVAVMYVVVAGLAETGGVGWIGGRLLGRPKSLLSAQLRMLIPVTGLSAFMNNTPLVAMFIPVINDWCKQYRLSPSKLMIPLSYAAIFGGTCTLIGTSTNLVVSGMWEKSITEHPGRAPIGMFDLAWFGIPCAVAGIVYIITVGRFLLPDRKPVLNVQDDARSYTVEMEVEPNSALAGKTIELAGLRNLPGLYLTAIERAGQMLSAVGPDEVLRAGDRLVFVGIVESIVDLQKIRGLRPATNQVVKLSAPRPQRCLIEAVVSDTSPLNGRSIREGRFRSVYNAVVIAVARNGERITDKKIGEIVLRTGDTLLLEAPTAFAEQHRNSRDFFLVSQIANSNPPRHDRAIMSIVILVGMVLAATFLERYGVKMIHAAVVAAGLMIVTRCCTGPQARRAVDWQVLTIIAAALGLGTALENTGAAKAIAEQMISLASNNAWATLAMIYLVTMIFTELITNNAAAALVFPIGAAAADKLGVDFKPYALTIMMAASASFSTPIGYQTNLMVMAPGGYRFSDYFRVGIPLNLLMMTVTVLIAPWIWPLDVVK